MNGDLTAARRVAVVIVNYRTADLAIDCLRSLAGEAAAMPAIHAVVVDNASGDGSVEKIAAEIQAMGWTRWATVRPLDHNGGFSRGNDAGVEPLLRCDPPHDYFLLLNPDTVVRPGAVRALVEFMDRHPGVGLAGSRLEDPDGTAQCSAFKFMTATTELVSALRLGVVSRLLKRWVITPPICDEPHPTDWLSGASLMIRRRVFEEIGLLDPAYFLYFEEVDFCMRARRAGWRCWYVPQSRVVHLVGSATGVSETRRKPPRRPAYWFESRRRYFLKNFGPLRAAMADLAWLVGYSLWRVRRAIQRKPDLDPPRLGRDFLRHSVFSKGFHLEHAA